MCLGGGTKSKFVDELRALVIPNCVGSDLGEIGSDEMNLSGLDIDSRSEIAALGISLSSQSELFVTSGTPVHASITQVNSSLTSNFSESLVVDWGVVISFKDGALLGFCVLRIYKLVFFRKICLSGSNKVFGGWRTYEQYFGD